MRVLILGANGMLGRDVAAAAPAGVELVRSRLPRVDIADQRMVQRALDETRPRWVINAAGYTAVDRAEEELDAAMAINGLAVGIVAAACADRDVALVHFSSDYVFSGRSSLPYMEDDDREPVSVYGRSKLAGEIALAQSGARALLIRTQWLFGLHGRSFPRTMWERASARSRTRVVDDQWGRPTYTRDLAAWTWQLIKHGALGTVHAANAGSASWYEVASHVFERAGAAELLSPCSTTDYPTRAIRPPYSVLDTGLLEQLVGPPEPWTHALDRFLDELQSA
jgi:dTDP-4-dehydrorhamnose reductase